MFVDIMNVGIFCTNPLCCLGGGEVHSNALALYIYFLFDNSMLTQHLFSHSYPHKYNNTTVYADLQILEQQRQESERQLQSARLHQKQKLAEQQQLEGKLLELKSQNGGMRAELQRASAELALRHRELQDAQTNADTSRKDTDRFDGKLKRVIG